MSFLIKKPPNPFEFYDGDLLLQVHIFNHFIFIFTTKKPARSVSIKTLYQLAQIIKSQSTHKINNSLFICQINVLLLDAR